MRLLMTADTVGGVWTYAIELSRALEPHGVHVVLATMGAPMDEHQRAQVNRPQNIRVHESSYELEWMQDPWDDLPRAGEWLLDLAQCHQPDVVHLNGYAHGALDWPAPVLIVGHSCVLSWWRAVKDEDAPNDWDRYRQLVTDGIRNAGGVVAPSQTMLRELRRFYAPLPPSAVVHNARDATRFPPGTKEPFILSAGRLWDEAKNLVALESAAKGLAWPVCVAGDDTCPDGRGVAAGGVQMLGKLPEEQLASWLSRASIYALPAKYEPFGLSILEAALCRCALVLGDIPSLREIWDDAATYVQPNDPAALRSAIQHLIDDAAQRERMMQRARSRASRYTTARMAAAYVDVYQQLASTAAGSDHRTRHFTGEERPRACAS